MSVDRVGGGGAIQSDMDAGVCEPEPAISEPEPEATHEVSAEQSEIAWTGHAQDVGAAMLAGGLRSGAAEVGEAAGGVLDSIGGWLGDRAEDLADAGRTLHQAADDVRDFVSEDIPATFEAAASYAEEGASRVNSFLGDLGDGLAERWNDVRDLGQGLIDKGNEAIDAAGRGLRELGEGAVDLAREGLERARGAGEAIAGVGRDLLSSVVGQLDAEKQIRALDSDGDTVVYELGVMAQAEIRGEASGKVEVKRVGDGPDAKYELTVSGDAGLGVVGQLGGSAGARAKAEAQAMLRAGGSVVMTFDSPEEAARAVGVLSRQAAVTALGNAAGGPLGAAAATAIAGPSADDLAFLGDHATAIELRGGISAEVSGSLGVGLDDGALRLAGVGAKLGADARIGARLILPQGDKPAQLQVYGEGTLAGNASLGLGLSETGGSERGGSLGIGAGAGGSVKARIERTFDLPRDVDVGALMSDPSGTLGRYAEQMRASEQVALTLTGDVNAQATGAGGVSRGVEVKVSGRAQEIQRALDATMEGGLDAGLRALDPALTVEAKTTSSRLHGFRLAPEISAFGVGVGVTVAAERNDQTVTGTATARPSEIVAWLQQQAERLAEQERRPIGVR